MKESQKYNFVNQDKRVQERNLKRHRLTETEYQKYLKSLPDEREWGEEQVVFKETERGQT